MAEYNLGRVAFIDKGYYSAEETYSKWDFVTTVDSTYLFVGTTPQIGKPVTDTNFWRCIANGKPATLAAALAQSAATLANTKAGLANDAAVLANELSSHPLTIQNDYWFRWNPETNIYENTGVKAKGDAFVYSDFTAEQLLALKGDSVEIVNNLTTGGAAKALSAEQGKILQDRNNQIVDDDGYFITDNNGNVVFEINKSGEISFTKLSQKTSQALSKNKISYDLIWCSIGTSITWFYLNENNFEHGYQWYVNEKFNFKQIKNIGVSGQNALQFSTTASINNITFADLYTIEHGTNDFLLNSPIGTFSDYLNNTGGATFYGAYRLIINKINTVNPRAVIVFTTPNKLKDYTREWDIINTAGHFLSDYANAIREIAEYNSSSIADCFNESGITKTTYTYYTLDGVHPNDSGHKAMAGLIIKELNKKTILWENRLL